MNTPIAMNDAVSGSQNPASTGAPASVLPLRARSEVPAETEAAARRRIAGHFARSVVPSPLRAPQSVEDCGLPQTFLVELVAKTIYQRGTGRLVELVNLLCLPGSVIEALCQFMRQDGIIEIGRRGANDADVHFDLTSAGRTRATEWLARNQYVGPAPVALDVYTERVRAQSVHKQRITRTQVGEAFRDLIMPEGIGDALGTALNSGKPLLIYGDAGAGKTYVASHVRRLLGGTIAIPHAVYVHGEVVRVFDAHWHTPALFPADLPASGIDNRARRCALGRVRTSLRLRGRRAHACDARPQLRFACWLLRGAPPREGQQRPLHRRRHGTPDGFAHGAHESMDRADGA